MRRPRVAVVVPSAARHGGGDVWLGHLLEELPARAMELLVVFETDGELAELARDAGHQVSVLGRAGAACDADLTGLVGPLARVLAAAKPQAVVHWSPRAHVYGTRARRLAGQDGPAAWVQHVISSDFWLHRLANSLPARAVACTSTAVAAANRRLYPHRHTVVLHPGVGCPPTACGKAWARADLGVPEDALLLGIVGRVEPWKGHDVAIRALHLLREQGLPAHALMVGETPSPTWPGFADDIEALIAHLDVDPHVSFVGHLGPPTVALASLDVLVCSSRQEGFSLAVAEGMAAGIPVVATRCGGPEDLISDGVNGLLAPNENPAALAEAIARLSRHRRLAARLAAAGRATWMARFTARHGADRFLAFVHDLVSGS